MNAKYIMRPTRCLFVYCILEKRKKINVKVIPVGSQLKIFRAFVFTASIIMAGREKISKIGIRINMGLEGAGSQFKKADKSGAKFALILGNEELKNNTISLKDLRSKSDQETLSYDDLEKRINETYK